MVNAVITITNEEGGIYAAAAIVESMRALTHIRLVHGGSPAGPHMLLAPANTHPDVAEALRRLAKVLHSMWLSCEVLRDPIAGPPRPPADKSGGN